MKKFNNYKNIEIFSTLTVKDAERLKIPQWQVNKRKFHQQTPVPGEKRYHCGTCNKDYKNIAQHNSKKHKTSDQIRWKCEECDVEFVGKPNFKKHLNGECQVLNLRCKICQLFKNEEQKQHPDRDFIIKENHNYLKNKAHYRSAFDCHKHF